MTIEEAEKLVPKQFRLACHTFDVIINEEGNYFGQFCISKNRIDLNLKIRFEDETVEVSKEAFINTFWHELMHVFNYFYNTETDEGIAQSFANFMCEFLETKQSFNEHEQIRF